VADNHPRDPLTAKPLYDKALGLALWKREGVVTVGLGSIATAVGRSADDGIVAEGCGFGAVVVGVLVFVADWFARKKPE